MSTEYPYTATATTDDYDYNYDYGNQACNKASVIHFGSIFASVVFIIVMIFSLFGNMLVLLIIVKYEDVKSITNTLLLNLAVSDLLFTAGLPFWVHFHVYGWTLGEPACKAVSFIFYLGIYSSSFLLILMTAHRYVAVINPLSDVVSIRGFYSFLAAAVIWVLSILAAIPSLIFSKVEKGVNKTVDNITAADNYCGYVDRRWKLFGIYQQNAVFILCSFVFVFCYSQILCKLLRPTPQRRNKTLKLIFMLIAVFFVGWAPYNIVIFFRSIFIWPELPSKLFENFCKTSEELDYAFYITRLFAISHYCLNPVFYVFAGVKFKTHLKKMLKSWRRKKKIKSRQSRVTITSQTSGEEYTCT